jgi:hypothetical protein
MCSIDITRSKDNKSICDGLGCSSEATNTIEEEIGDMGVIKLELCDDCVIKFREQ